MPRAPSQPEIYRARHLPGLDPGQNILANNDSYTFLMPKQSDLVKTGPTGART